jgi:hypothetical protein
MSDPTTNDDEHQQRELRSLQLEQISAKSLLEIKTLLQEILAELRKNRRQPDDWLLNGWRQS